jgi:DNA-directed RNA polymerase specialized sigma24 family protein
LAHTQYPLLRIFPLTSSECAALIEAVRLAHRRKMMSREALLRRAAKRRERAVKYYLRGWPFRRIAEKLGVSDQGARVMIRRAAELGEVEVGR